MKKKVPSTLVALLLVIIFGSMPASGASVIQPFDVTFVIDTSNSMASSAEFVRTSIAKEVSNLLDDRPNTRIAIVATGSNSICGFTDEKTVLLDKIENLNFGGSTRLGATYDMVQEALGSSYLNAYKMVIVCSDGVASDDMYRENGADYRYSDKSYQIKDYARYTSAATDRAALIDADILSIRYFSEQKGAAQSAEYIKLGGAHMQDIQTLGCFEASSLADLSHQLSFVVPAVVLSNNADELRENLARAKDESMISNSQENIFGRNYTFQYWDTGENGEPFQNEITINWDISLFENTHEYNDELAKVSMLLCKKSYEGWGAFFACMSRLGFRDIRYVPPDFGEVHTGHHAFAHQPITVNGQELELVLCFTQGTTGTLEWISDVAMSYDAQGDYLGFSVPADKVLLKRNDYLEELGLDAKGIFEWFTGHSRGGAISGIASKKSSDYSSTDNKICYTFASPNTTLNIGGLVMGDYYFIYNIVIALDPITGVPPGHRYGLTLGYGTNGTENWVSMFEQLYGFTIVNPLDFFFIQCHYPETYMKAMRLEEPPEAAWDGFKWWWISNECPTDIQTEVNGKPIASVMSVDNGSYIINTVDDIFYADKKGEGKYFLLPDNGDSYDLLITATDDGSMLSTIIEINSGSDVESKFLVESERIYITNGETYHSVVGADEEVEIVLMPSDDPEAVEKKPEASDDKESFIETFVSKHGFLFTVMIAVLIIIIGWLAVMLLIARHRNKNASIDH